MSVHEIQVLTHCDPQRALRACILAASVPSDVAVLCAVNGGMADVSDRLGPVIPPANLRFLPTRHREVYPANALRNLSLHYATAEWIFYADADFVFCDDFWTILDQTMSLKIPHVGDNLCLCPVALWAPDGSYITTGQDPEILKHERLDTHAPPRSWEQTSRTSLFKFHDLCFSRAYGPNVGPYEITERMVRLRKSSAPAEPWGMLKRKHACWADESFRAGPFDKQQFVCALLDRGLRFFAVPEVFMFHLWHPERPGWPDRIRNRALWIKRHSHNQTHRYLLVAIAGAMPSRFPGAFARRLAEAIGTKISTESRASDAGTIPRVIIGPDHLSRELFTTDRKVCVFFLPPAFHRVCDPSGIPRTYAQLFCNTVDLGDAMSLMDNATVLCDLSAPKDCVKSLQDITGIDIDEEWLTLADVALEQEHDIESDRRVSHEDYLLYDYAVALGKPR